MDAKRCDRCGKFYENISEFVGVRIPSNLHEGKYQTITEIGNSCKNFDLCPECWKIFGEWWESAKDE